MARLSSLQVKNAKPGRLADGKGLYLLTKPSGSKSWVLRIQVDGRRRDYGLGSLDVLSLSEAREKAAQWRKVAKEGLDPAVEWRKARRTVPTFEQAAREFHENHKASWRNSKHAAQWLTTLETYAFPCIGRKTVDQIDAPDFQTVLTPIWLVKPETARRVRQRIAVVLDYAHGKGWRSTEAPMRAVSSLLKGLRQPKKSNFAALPYSDLPPLMAKLLASPRVGSQALAFLILTAARSGEVRGAVWNEIDLDRAVWTVPAARMKMKEQHQVPLSAPALAILKTARDLHPHQATDLVFPGLRKKPLSDMTLGKALKSAGVESATVHGMRSSFRDWAAESGQPGDWAEAALAHAVSNRVEAAYRRTKFLDQRRNLMTDWAEYIVTNS